MKKTVDIQNDHKGISTTAAIALGTADEIGIRGDVPYSAKGDLIVEYYNCSAALQEALSSEYCYTTLVSKKDKPRLVETIRNEGKTAQDEDEDWLILRYLKNNFTDHKEVRHWLMQHHIPYRKFYDANWGASPTPADVEDAEQLARLAHVGQTDKAGADYIEHPLRVANSFATQEVAANDEEQDYANFDYERQHEISNLQIIALLHDTIEDTWVTAEYLERSGYEPEVIAAIEALTKLPDEEGSDAGYEKFIRRAASNPLALRVKIADIKDNMDLSRIANPTDKDHARIAKYRKALKYLESQETTTESR